MRHKVLHIIVKTGYDGVTSYSIRLIKNLPQYNHQILSCYKGNAIEEIKGMNISYEHLLNADSISIKHLLLKYYKIISYLRKNEFDIVHYHQGGVGLILLAAIFGKNAKVIHHLHSGNLIGNNKKQEISVVHLLFLKFISKFTKQVAVADHVFIEYKTKVNLSTNLQLIKNSTPFNYQKKQEIMNAVGFIGRFTEEKGFPVFLSLASKLNIKKPELNILTKGEFSNTNNTSIKQIPASFNVESFYKCLDLLLYLSRAPESLPLVILEAIAFDVGIIAYPLKGVVEILGEDYPLLIKNENEIISKIEYFYSDKFDMQKLSDIHKVRSRIFKFDEMIGKLNSLYDLILTKN